MRINIKVKGSPNIALVKYWGKKDRILNTPLNGSLSLTLSSDDLWTETEILIDDSLQNDEFCINNQIKDLASEKKIQSMITLFRSLTNGYLDNDGNICISKEILSTLPIHIHTSNSFPTAAGLASSASGFSCLVKSLSLAYQVYYKEEEENLLNAIMRKGSGSACRSMYGGFVEWNKGEKDDGSDSIAHPICSNNYWPEMRVLILINSRMDIPKDVKSTSGMNLATETSELLQYRSSVIVPKRLTSTKEAIFEKNFQVLSECIMKESNQLHAICLDTYPPVMYLNTTSFKIINLVHKLNEYYNKNIVAYTFDAGSNAFLFTLENYINDMNYLLSFFSIQSNKQISYNEDAVSDTMKSFVSHYKQYIDISLQDICYTKAGSGISVLENSYTM
ncbi:hypothetical protein WA158_002181 [Blastocystis sp. Blastoise]